MIELPIPFQSYINAQISQSRDSGIAQALLLQPAASHYWSGGSWSPGCAGGRNYAEISKSIIDEFNAFFPCDVDFLPGHSLQGKTPDPPPASLNIPITARPREGRFADADKDDAYPCPLYRKMKATNRLKKTHICQNLNFTGKQQQLKHLREQHISDLCPFCEDRLESQPEWVDTVDLGNICFEGSAALRAHLLAGHLAPYVCCGKRFGAAAKFNKHLEMVHSYKKEQISFLRKMKSNHSPEMACLVEHLGGSRSKGDFKSHLYKDSRKVYDLRDIPPTDRLKESCLDYPPAKSKRYLEQVALCPAETPGQTTESTGLQRGSPILPVKMSLPRLARTFSPATILPENTHAPSASRSLADTRTTDEHVSNGNPLTKSDLPWSLTDAVSLATVSSKHADFPLVLGMVDRVAGEYIPDGHQLPSLHHPWIPTETISPAIVSSESAHFQPASGFQAGDMIDEHAHEDYPLTASDVIPSRTSIVPPTIFPPAHAQIPPANEFVHNARITEAYEFDGYPYPTWNSNIEYNDVDYFPHRRPTMDGGDALGDAISSVGFMVLYNYLEDPSLDVNKLDLAIPKLGNPIIPWEGVELNHDDDRMSEPPQLIFDDGKMELDELPFISGEDGAVGASGLVPTSLFSSMEEEEDIWWIN